MKLGMAHTLITKLLLVHIKGFVNLGVLYGFKLVGREGLKKTVGRPTPLKHAK